MLYSLWLFLVLVLRVVYQGKLYDSFRSPYNPPLPSKISQLIAENYTLITQEYYDYYPHNLTVLFTESTQDRFDRIQRDGEDERLTTTALIANIGYNNRINWQTSHLTHVREHIFLYQLVMYLHVHSLLKFGFDRKLKQLQSSGIIGYIVHDFDRPQYRVPPTEPHEISPLPLEVFCGLYFIATILLTAAVLAFLVELLSVRVAWLRRYLV
ncbi:GL14725 [Drosophila persimilis]|uniref:GL14725 n=1 Tax=Drosophila persimilis TaxID=7234 RepID=B4GVV1_DROPE|nr:GL14725 [Drosophila persimilis]